MSKYEKIKITQDAMRELNNALVVDVTFDNAREAIAVRLGYLYKALEELEKEYGYNVEEVFGEQIAEIQTLEKGA